MFPALNDMHKLETEKLGQAQQAHAQLAQRAAPQGRQPPPATIQALFWGSSDSSESVSFP